MNSICQAELEALLERDAIRECLYRYCRGIDRADESILRTTYWEDARDCHGAYQGSANGFIRQAIDRLKTGGRGVHQISNILIELHGSQAAVESSFMALQSTAAHPGVETFLAGRYVDLFEKRSGQWRVTERTVVYDWIEERPRPELASNNADLFNARQPNGTRDTTDPIYRLLDRVRTPKPEA